MILILVCDDCGGRFDKTELDEGELRGKRHEGLTIPYHCPNCGNEVLSRSAEGGRL